MPDIPFVFAGNGTQKAKTEHIDNAYLIPFQQAEALKAVIQHAEFTLHPAIWYENCPFAVMESQLYGTPVIASRIGGLKELVEEGITGDLFEAGNSAEFKDGIRALWNDTDRLATYRNNCTKRASDNFPDLQRYCEDLLTLISECSVSQKILQIRSPQPLPER